ncbi:uncharacterized protein LODBEIA_P37190 [Lodderomyces beijingensis]|uniref:Uncharacterized protein n=1 Tax=Lodderomyces beijingensis TaxID=1775926 RepID=A0ABP0ZTJ7_9ASCO
MVFKSMFREYSQSHGYSNWSSLYDVEKLKRITWDQVPIVAATYYADQYVDFHLSNEVKRKYFARDNLRQFIINEYFHNGSRADPEKILGTLFKLLKNDVD